MPTKKTLSERDRKRMESDREELAERIARARPRDGTTEVKPGLFLNRISSPDYAVHAMLQPSCCVVAAGSKELSLGGETFRYDAAHYLIATIGVPAAVRIVAATPERPYLSVRFLLDPAVVFRLLTGAQAARLCHLARLSGHDHRMVRAVKTLTDEFNKPLRVEDVADDVGMSVSGFHAHFKAATNLSPLQFQKHLRLQEARRLMLSENLDAGEAGYRVGYEDQSHFSRDYKRHFGEPPMRDVERMREMAGASGRFVVLMLP